MLAKKVKYDKEKGTKDSKNRIKARARLARRCEKVRNRRNDTLNKISTQLVRDSQASVICIEDLNVKGMMKNHNLAKSIADVSWGGLRRMLEYKCKWYGVRLEVIDRFYPSSKTCNICGYVKKDLTLKIREWTCPNCGTHHDRDLNAAINIKEIGLETLSTERGDVKPVDYPTMDLGGASSLRSSGSEKQEKRKELAS